MTNQNGVSPFGFGNDSRGRLSVPTHHRSEAINNLPHQAVYRGPAQVSAKTGAGELPKISLRDRGLISGASSWSTFAPQRTTQPAHTISRERRVEVPRATMETTVLDNDHQATEATFMPTIPVYSKESVKRNVAKHHVVAQSAIATTIPVKPVANHTPVKTNSQRILDDEKIKASAMAHAKLQAELNARAHSAALHSQQHSAKQSNHATQQHSTAIKHEAIKRHSHDLTAAIIREENLRTQDQTKTDNEQPINIFMPVSPTSPLSSISNQMQPALAGVAPQAPIASPVANKNINKATAKAVHQAKPIVSSSSATKSAAKKASDVNGMLARLANSQVTFSFKFNKQRIAAFLRGLAVVVIIASTAYLAWDTYSTNRSAQGAFNGSNTASAMSISGTNPATADQTAISQEARAAYTVPADQPRYIYIPDINVNARVMSVGVNSRGNIDTPSNLNDTAWYDGSAKPGQEGQVFIDGHTSFSSGIAAAFNNLGKLQAGSIITIEKGNGEKINYKTVAVKTVAANAVDMGEALNPPKGAERGLTLMTCTGTFNYRTQTADKRLIVYAVQE